MLNVAKIELYTDMHSFSLGNWNQMEVDRKKKKRSRWNNDDTDRISIPGMPTALPADVTPEQERQYLGKIQILLTVASGYLNLLEFNLI